MSSEAFSILSDFLRNRMRMSHIYQPLMLKSLIQNGGNASVRQIAAAFLAEDESQLQYYENITKQMPGRILGKHGLVIRDRDDYVLAGKVTGMTPDEQEEIVRLCDEAVDGYKEKRGDAVWQHRVSGLGYVPGNRRYTVLKRAGFRCELCGISAEDRALDVDHILPRKHGGTDDLENLQALCWKCNANKGAGDATDFRAVREGYRHREKGCPFCEIPEKRIIAGNSLAFAIRDKFPVTDHHTLVIPKRHVSDFFDLHGGERNAVQSLLDELRTETAKANPTIEGFNVGINCGEVAGQTIFHCHVHLIPRQKGDVENPRGGVRHTIPGKGDY